MRQVLKWAAVPIIAATVLLACNKGKPTSTTPTASDAHKGSCSFDNCIQGANKKTRSGPLNFYAVEANMGGGNGFYSGVTTGSIPITNPIIGSLGDNIIRENGTQIPLEVKGIATEFNQSALNNSTRMFALVIDANQDYAIYRFDSQDPNSAFFVANIRKAGVVQNTSNATLVDIEFDYMNGTIGGGQNVPLFASTEFRLIALDQMNNEVMSIDYTNGNVITNTIFYLGGPGSSQNCIVGSNTYTGLFSWARMVGVPISLGWVECTNIFSGVPNPTPQHSHPIVLSVQQLPSGRSQFYLSKFADNTNTPGQVFSGFGFGWSASLDDMNNKISPFDPNADDYGIMYDHYGSAGFIIGNNKDQFSEDNTSIMGPYYFGASSLPGENALSPVLSFIDFAPGTL
jgi:hypothetical protein